MKRFATTFAMSLFIGLLSSPAQAQAVGRWYEVSEGSWRVPARVVSDMRSRIEAAAQDAVPRSTTKEVRSVINDTVQYQGFIDPRTKRRLIELYGMCETKASPAQLRDFWSYTYDGGNCFYWARFDPTLRQFVSFEFNSAA